MSATGMIVLAVCLVVSAFVVAITIAELMFRSDCKSWGRREYYLNRTWTGRLESKFLAWKARRARIAEHPESQCSRCHGPNPPSWSAPSPLWNAVMRGGSINGVEEFGVVCPTCFVVLAEERGIASFWRLSAERVYVELETVTPSGRVWNEQTWMFDEQR